MNVDAFLRELTHSREYRGQIVHVHEVAAREARYQDLTQPPPPKLEAVLRPQGIERFYTHQAEAIEAIRRGENVVVVTGTASGKTLCYNVPVIETLLNDPRAKALYLYPTKALAQDQLRVLVRLKELDPSLPLEAGTYDGDTPQEMRRTLRDKGNVILTNPDMLHSGILPNHSRWSDFFAQLRYVVVDEVHSYRGIFGSNVGNVMRRLRRICAHYQAKPQFVCASATIDNPDEHAARIVGEPFTKVDQDGSPRGPKRFVLWNPPFLDEGKMERRSPNTEAQRLMVEFVRSGVQTITFVRARVTAEVLYRYVHDELVKDSPRLKDKVRAYRGGYLAEDRREIERALFSGELLGVTTTNALELGIDIGGLDVAILVGYPGTIASTWQQAGRAGRGSDEALVILIAQNSPIDQYLMQHREYFFDQTVEQAVIDPTNPYILSDHLRCACAELPLRAEEAADFGEDVSALMPLLEESNLVYWQNGRWYWRGDSYPARNVNLRVIDQNNYAIQDETDPDEKKWRVIGQLDEYSAFLQLHPQAIYMHQGETYFVETLGIEPNQRVAHVKKAEFDYYTQAIDRTDIRVEGADLDNAWRVSRSCFGPVIVTDRVYMFRKVKFGSRDSVGFGGVDLPEHELNTDALWVVPPAQVLERVRQYGRIPEDGLLGIANAALGVLPLWVMCDPADVGATVNSSNTPTPAIFIYDRYPGGIGYAQKAHGLVEQVLESALYLIEECECEEGCPSCVGSPLPPFGQQGSDMDSRGKIPDKEAALCILHDLLQKEPYEPKALDPAKRERRMAAAMSVAALPEPEDEPAADVERPPVKRLPENVEKKIRRRIQRLRGPSR